MVSKATTIAALYLDQPENLPSLEPVTKRVVGL